MSQSLIELSARIVEDSYGSVAGEIVILLCKVGRLTARDLAKHTGLSASAIYRTLVSLVQQRLVLHWSDASRKTTWYSANPLHIYSSLWAGPTLALYAARHKTSDPESAVYVLNKLVIHDHMSGAQVMAHTAKDPHGISPDAVRTALTELVRNKVVIPLDETDFWPAEDYREQSVALQFRQLAAEKVLGLSEAARKAQALAMANDHESKMETKKSYALKNIIEAGADGNIKIDETKILGLNRDQFLITERRAELVALAATRVGPITAKVYEQVLIATERHLFDVQQRRIPGNDTNVSVTELVRMMGNSSSELAQVFTDAQKHDIKTEEESAPKRLRTLNGATKRNGLLSSPEPENPMMEVINKHLRLLEESSSVRFIMRAGDRNGGEWFVPFDSAIEGLRRVIFDEMVADTFGPLAARLVRIVRERGKIDEKALSQVALLQPKEIRHHVNNLQNYGLIDLQEVPRGNDRAPGRNFYFWYHRPQQAYARLVEQLYGSIINSVDEVRKLRKTHETLLTKLRREDVQNQPDQFLTQSEKDELRTFMAAQEKLVASQVLVDRYVRIFRDY